MIIKSTSEDIWLTSDSESLSWMASSKITRGSRTNRCATCRANTRSTPCPTRRANTSSSWGTVTSFRASNAAS